MFALRRAICIAALLLSTPAMAGLVGSTVSVTARFGIGPSIIANPGNAVVGGGVEYVLGSFGPNYSPFMSVDLTDDRFILTYSGAQTVSFPVSPFNGFYLTMVSGPRLISGIGVAAESDFLPIAVQNNNDEITINFSGVTGVRPGMRSVVLLQTERTSVVPLPAAGWLLLGGLAVIGGMARRRR
jgi:hypothetical protein